MSLNTVLTAILVVAVLALALVVVYFAGVIAGVEGAYKQAYGREIIKYKDNRLYRIVLIPFEHKQDDVGGDGC